MSYLSVVKANNVARSRQREKFLGILHEYQVNVSANEGVTRGWL